MGGSFEEIVRSEKTAVTYAALGDSTGIGVGAHEGGGYVARLFERIRRERPDSRLVNLCVSGATTEDVLREQLRAAASARPSLVTLGIGINDLGHGMTAERFARNYEEIVRRLKTEMSARVVVTNVPDISLAPVIPPSEREATRRRIELFNEKLEAIARRHELSVVDVYSETHRVIPAHPEFFSEDGFHPSAEGYAYWADTMWPAVKAAIGD
jgi:lysophospholipase L1-like esterase